MSTPTHTIGYDYDDDRRSARYGGDTETTPPLPADIGAEQAVLGAVLMSPVALTTVAATITPDDWYDPKHQVLWTMIARLHQDGLPVDPVTVADVLRRSEHARRIHLTYLADLVEAVLTPANVAYHVALLRAATDHRRLIAAGARLTQTGMARGDVPGAVAAATSELDAIVTAATDTGPKLLADGLYSTLDMLEQPEGTGIPTGYPDLDDLIGGLRAGQFWTVGGRPGSGKTIVGMDIARHTAVTLHRPALVFSLEMTLPELLTRTLAATARVQLDHLNLSAPALTEDDWSRISRHLPDLLDAPLLINDDASITLPQLIAQTRATKRAYPDLAVVVVDYLQLLSVGKSAESRRVEVDMVSRGLKVMAKQLGVPVIALSQLNRNAEARTDHRPALSDMRESGSLEQDSDGVILVHRDDYYDRDSPNAGEVELVLAKNRSGRTGVCKLAGTFHYARLSPLARYEQPL